MKAKKSFFNSPKGDEIITRELSYEEQIAFFQDYLRQHGYIIDSPNKPKRQKINFDQAVICDDVLKEPRQYPTLNKCLLQFNGLCELISNYVIMEDLLGKSGESESVLDKTYLKSNFKMERHEEQNLLKEKITLSSINNDKVKSSHILHVSTFFEKVKAYVFNIYPHSLFSSGDIMGSNKIINEKRLGDKLKDLPVGSYIKFSVFKKGFLSFAGHSLVIKKTGEDDYSFFDPNEGERTHLSVHKIANKIMKTMKRYDGTHMAFMDGGKYIERLKKEHAELFTQPSEESPTMNP